MDSNKKTILVTGGAGFIGSHLCEQLVKDGHNVISLDNYFTGTKDNHVSGVDYREGHTKDIEKHITEKPDMVYHLGEYSRVEQSFNDVPTVWDFNIIGTFAVLEFAKKNNYEDFRLSKKFLSEISEGQIGEEKLILIKLQKI